MKTWLFLTNPFLTAAKKSYRQAVKISTYHNSQLHAHIGTPFYDSLYASFNPIYTALIVAYTNWLAQGGTQKGSTLSVDQLLKLLSPTKVNAWEYAVIGLFPKGTPEYVAIFPQGKNYFRKGSKETRIAAVNQLSKSLAGIPGLAAIKIEVDVFFSQLTQDRQIQLGNKGKKGIKSNAVEIAIENAMIEMYGNYGLIINKFKDMPAKAELFFDVETIRDHEQLIFKKKVKADNVKNIMEHTFGAEDSITLINDGTATLQFYLASSPTTTAPVLMPLVLFPNSQQTVVASTLGDLKNRWLNVYNGEINDGHCTLEMM